MRIELLHVDDCPSAPLARERLAAALRRLGLDDVVVTEVRVADDEDAQRLGFLGSPSVRVDGIELLTTGAEAIGLSCRRYATPDGLSGCPTQAQLDEALSTLRGGPAALQTTP
ncbi:MAG TPA: hypothetical protein VFL59_14135 [Candidatus Nanopelagicales bacterium]|nr:hypothetical protein [Candidatus Nanopelagicales bacterium]